jgi:ABC-type antimicrobial peptide transport system permease subunit
MLEEVVAADLAPRRVQIAALAAFAAVAFLLAGLGIHGLLAFTINARVREIGVRIALGARPASIVGLVMRRTAWWAAAGIAVGTVAALAAGRTLESLLAGVPPGDAPTLAGAVLLALGMALAGSLLPALRAIRVDPLVALRQPD